MLMKSVEFASKEWWELNKRESERIEDSIVRLREEGYEYKEICDALGVSRGRVWKVLSKHGLVHKFKDMDKVTRTVHRLYKNGYTIPEIARTLRISEKSVRQLVRKLDYPYRWRVNREGRFLKVGWEHPRPFTIFELHKAYKLHVEEGWSILKLMKILGGGYMTVRRYIQAYGAGELDEVWEAYDEYHGDRKGP